MRVLLVEDDQHLGAAVRTALAGRNVTVDWVQTVQGAFDRAMSGAYDCLLLDVKLPDGDGVSLVTDVRESGCTTPILIFTVMNETADRVRGLMAGADDYIGKPVDMEELFARIQALVRRSTLNHGVDRLDCGPATLWCQTRTLQAQGKKVQLSSKEYLLLAHLIRNAGQVLTRDQLIAHVWGPDAEVADSALDTYIYFLRRKCEGVGLKGIIQTVRGEGYTLRTGKPGNT